MMQVLKTTPRKRAKRGSDAAKYRYAEKKKRGQVRVKRKENPPPPQPKKFQNVKRKWNDTRTQGDPRPDKSASNPAPLANFPPIITPKRGLRRTVGVKPGKNLSPVLTGGPGGSTTGQSEGDPKPWESEFWPEGKCSRWQGNENCQCGKPPTYPKPWEGADAYLPGCPKSDDDIGQVVSEESGRFG